MYERKDRKIDEESVRLGIDKGLG